MMKNQYVYLLGHAERQLHGCGAVRFGGEKAEGIASSKIGSELPVMYF